MNSIKILIELLNHMEWADSTVWKVIQKFPESENDKKLKDILIHYNTAQRLYLNVWKGLPFDRNNQPELNSLNLILQEFRSYYKGLNEFSNEMDKYDLNKVIDFPWAARIEKILGKKPAEANLAEMILQVAVHSSHHRGQLNKRLREIGSEPETIDFIAWIWLGKPAPEWGRFPQL